MPRVRQENVTKTLCWCKYSYRFYDDGKLKEEYITIPFNLRKSNSKLFIERKTGKKLLDNPTLIESDSKRYEMDIYDFIDNAREIV